MVKNVISVTFIYSYNIIVYKTIHDIAYPYSMGVVHLLNISFRLEVNST